MKKATSVNIAVTTAFYMLCGCMGYAAFGDLAPGNLLTGFGFYNPYWLLDIANVAIVVHLVGAYQVYRQPLFAFTEKWAAQKWPHSDFITKGNHLVRCSQPAMPWASTRFLCPDADPMAMNPKFFCHADHYPPPDHPSNSSMAQSHPQQPLRPSNSRCRRWSLPLVSPPPSSSRFPSSSRDGGATSSAGHGCGGASASRSSSPPPLFLHTVMAIIDMKAQSPRRLAIRWPPCCFFKNKVAAPLDLRDGCFGWWAPKAQVACLD